jgi:hypothetical protein
MPVVGHRWDRFLELAAKEESRSGWSAAWGVVFAVLASATGLLLVPALSGNAVDMALLIPGIVFGLGVLFAIYLVFAPLLHWWPHTTVARQRPPMPWDDFESLVRGYITEGDALVQRIANEEDPRNLREYEVEADVWERKTRSDLNRHDPGRAYHFGDDDLHGILTSSTGPPTRQRVLDFTEAKVNRLHMLVLDRIDP